MNRILITGAGGFIGSHLAQSLVEDGFAVFGLGRSINKKNPLLDSLRGIKLFQAIEQSVEEPIRGDFDAIFNLASPASLRENMANPLGSIRTNVLGTWNLLEFAKERGCSIFHASTSEVYGDPQITPQHEGIGGNSRTFGPRAAYVESKRLAETLVFEYQKRFSVRASVGRIFSAYGPGMPIGNGRLIPTFIQQAISNEPLTIFGDGKQLRSFTYVDDIVAGVRALQENSQNLDGPINLGSRESITTLGLAKLVIGLVNSKSEIVHLSDDGESPASLVPDPTKAFEMAGWKAQVTIEKGIVSTIQYMRSSKFMH